MEIRRAKAPLDLGSPISGVVKHLVVLLVTFSVGLGTSAFVSALNGEPTPPSKVVTRSSLMPALSEPLTPIVVEVPVQPAVQSAAPSSQKVTRKGPRTVRTTQLPVALAPPQPVNSAPAIKCNRLDDAKIDWLLEQVGKTRVEHPEVALGASKIESALMGARGKNLCAAEAQQIVRSLCADPEAVRALNTMVSRLPFFVRPMVGDPCQADLVETLNKVGRYVPGLASSPT